LWLCIYATYSSGKANRVSALEHAPEPPDHRLFYRRAKEKAIA